MNIYPLSKFDKLSVEILEGKFRQKITHPLLCLIKSLAATQFGHQ